MSRFIAYGNRAAAVILVLGAIRILFHIGSTFLQSDEPRSSVELVLMAQTIAMPLSLFAAAYLLVFNRHRMIVIALLAILCAAWLPPLLRLTH